MNKFFTFLSLLIFSLNVKAQTPPGNSPLQVQSPPKSFKETEPYGKVDIQDLVMKSCDFEKDANAEVLFDKANVYPDGNMSIMERHTRIKIFNDFAKNQANVRLDYISYLQSTAITNLEAETINLENGNISISKLDKKGIFIEHIDKLRSALIFALPNVKAGSVIEFKYRVALDAGYFPIWYFQSTLPERYSEIKTAIQPGQEFMVAPHVTQPYSKQKGSVGDYEQIRALSYVHSLPDEPYMGARQDNLQRVEVAMYAAKLNTWDKIGDFSVKAPDFGQEIAISLPGEGEIIKHAKDLTSDDERIAFIFDTVRNRMKWNEIYRFYAVDGTVRTWKKNVGNSFEINMILCRLLKKSGINATPMIISTKNIGKLNPASPNIYIFSSMIVYIQSDTSKKYVLDATGKYNLYNTVPPDDLNTFGLNIDEDNKEYKPFFLENSEPSMQSVVLNAEIKADGKLAGTAEINSYSYNKMKALKKYKTDGEEKYIKYLNSNDNGIRISSLKLEGMNVDSLPLTLKFDFNGELPGADQNYLYVNTNSFNVMGENPFKSEERFSNIDFGFKDNFSINNVYKLPPGYKTDVLPKSITIIIPDQSITFKRTVAEENGIISVRYVLIHKKTLYFREDYQDIRGFYKKMYELLNEQIVLKKSG